MGNVFFNEVSGTSNKVKKFAGGVITGSVTSSIFTHLYFFVYGATENDTSWCDTTRVKVTCQIGDNNGTKTIVSDLPLSFFLRIGEQGMGNINTTGGLIFSVPIGFFDTHLTGVSMNYSITVPTTALPSGTTDGDVWVDCFAVQNTDSRDELHYLIYSDLLEGQILDLPEVNELKFWYRASANVEERMRIISPIGTKDTNYLACRIGTTAITWLDDLQTLVTVFKSDVPIRTKIERSFFDAANKFVHITKIYSNEFSKRGAGSNLLSQAGLIAAAATSNDPVISDSIQTARSLGTIADPNQLVRAAQIVTK